MKKATLIIWAIIIVLIAIVFHQNWAFFEKIEPLNIIFVKEQIKLPVWSYFIVFFFFGFIAAYLFNFSARFKTRRTTKKLNAAITSHQNEVSELKSELNALKGPDPPAAVSAAGTKTDTIIELSDDNLVEKSAAQPGKSSIDNKKSSTTKD